MCIRNYTGSVSYPEKVAPLHPAKLAMYGKVFPHLLIFRSLRSSTSPCPEGSFLAPEISRLFGDTVGASLVRGLGCQLVVAMMCDADVCGLIPTTRLKRVVEWGRQTSSQGGTRFRMLRAHVKILMNPQLSSASSKSFSRRQQTGHTRHKTKCLKFSCYSSHSLVEQHKVTRTSQNH